MTEMNQTGKVQYGQLLRIAVILLLVVLVGILVFQNREDVDTRVFFFTVTMPRAALVFTAFAIGMVTGVLASWSRFSRWRRERTEKPE